MIFFIGIKYDVYKKIVGEFEVYRNVFEVII